MHRLEDREKERKRAIERNEEEERQRQIERGRLSGAPNLRGKASRAVAATCSLLDDVARL